MEFRVLNKHNEPHNCIVVNDEVSITRLSFNGGIPKTVKLTITRDTGFSEAIDKITALINQDTDIYNMLVEHTKNKGAQHEN